MRWVTFYYNVMIDTLTDVKVHNNKEDALKYFNKHCNQYFQLNTRFKTDKLPAVYGYPMRKYCGISARQFKKEFNRDIDEFRLTESEK